MKHQPYINIFKPSMQKEVVLAEGLSEIGMTVFEAPEQSRVLS